jgi:hypothetical protein
MFPYQKLVFVVAMMAPAVWADHDEFHEGISACPTGEEETETDDGHGHGDHDHHRRVRRGRRLNHPTHETMLTATAECGNWEALIEEYAESVVENGGHHGVYLEQTAERSHFSIMTTIMLNGDPLADASVMGHLHEKKCSDESGGDHYRHDTTIDLNTDSNEVHFMWETNHMGMGGDEAVCNAWPIRNPADDPTHGARSVVLHESHENFVVGMGARKLCCDLEWTKLTPIMANDPKDEEDKDAAHGTTVLAALATALACFVFV